MLIVEFCADGCADVLVGTAADLVEAVAFIEKHSGLLATRVEAAAELDDEELFNVGEPDSVLRNGARADRVCYAVRPA